VRSLVELHGGHVAARSEGLGHGSEFIVQIPTAEIDSVIEDQDRTLQPTALSTVEKGRRILVVDDLLSQAKSLAILLQRRGHDVRIAHDGPHALHILQEFAADVALVDIGLPGMDGYSLARRIREQQRFKSMRSSHRPVGRAKTTDCALMRLASITTSRNRLITTAFTRF
jgi:CheY-like chemotaxis protein